MMLQKLVEKGFTQQQIADLVKRRGANCNHSQVSKILRGRDPSYTLGDAIRKVYMEHCEAPEARQ